MRQLSAMRLGTMRLTSAPAGARAAARQIELAELAGRAVPRGLPVLDTRERGTEFRELPVRSALNSAAATHMGFWSINPYIGCEFGCSYCYARDTHRYTVERHAASGDLSPEADAALLSKPAVDAFERHILVKTQPCGHPDAHAGACPRGRRRHRHRYRHRSLPARRAAFRHHPQRARGPAEVQSPPPRHHHQVTAHHPRHPAAARHRGAPPSQDSRLARHL